MRGSMSAGLLALLVVAVALAMLGWGMVVWIAHRARRRIRIRSGQLAGGQRPRPLDSSEIYLYRIPERTGPPHRQVGIVTRDLRRVRCADVWVNSENTQMTMARIDEFSVSSIIRYQGAQRDDV